MSRKGRESHTPGRRAQLAAGLLVASTALALLPHIFRRRRNQIVVITGGSRGLGLALAERFARSGARLVLCSRNFEELLRARATLLSKKFLQSVDDILLVQADVADADQVSELIRQSIDHFGRIDVLINNAGVIEVGPVEDQTFEMFQRAMDTNFFGAVRTVQAVLPHFLSRPSKLGDAAIVNIASIGGKFAMPHMLPYVASKFALVGFSEGLHAELRQKRVRVTTVCPGLMRTGGEAHAQFTGQIERERSWFDFAAKTPVVAASVEHAANKIYNAVASGRAEITITPQAWLAARMVGVAPETTQFLASLASKYILPAPVNTMTTTGQGSACITQEVQRTPWNAETF